MPKRLRDKAKQAGKSLAGTLGEGAKRAKRKAKQLAKDPETGIELSQIGDKYIVIDGDGDTHGPFDERMKAAAKARELKREAEGAGDGANGQSRAQAVATKFATKVNEAARAAGEKGRDFAEQAAEQPDEPRQRERQGERQQPQGPSLGFLEGGQGEMDSSTLPFESGGGQGDGPSLDFLGGGMEQPQMPQFGPPADDGEREAQLPMMGEGPDMGQLPFGEPREGERDRRNGRENEFDPLRFF